MFKNKILFQVGLCFLMILCELSMSIAFAKEFRVDLIATIDNGPAMEDVKWTVYRSGDDKYKKTASRHSTYMIMPRGVYKAVAHLKKDGEVKVRSRKFHVNNNTQVIVSMD